MSMNHVGEENGMRKAKALSAVGSLVLVLGPAIVTIVLLVLFVQHITGVLSVDVIVYWALAVIGLSLFVVGIIVGAVGGRMRAKVVREQTVDILTSQANDDALRRVMDGIGARGDR